MAFPKPVDWNKIQACTQKSGESAHGYYNQLQIVFKGNSGFPSHVDSTWGAFNSMFTNGLNRDFPLLVIRTRMERQSMSTPDLVNLTNQLSHTADESPPRKTTKMLNFQLQQMKAPKQDQNPPSFCYYCKEPGLWKRDCYKVKCSRRFQLSN